MEGGSVESRLTDWCKLKYGKEYRAQELTFHVTSVEGWTLIQDFPRAKVPFYIVPKGTDFGAPPVTGPTVDEIPTTGNKEAQFYRFTYKGEWTWTCVLCDNSGNRVINEDSDWQRHGPFRSPAMKDGFNTGHLPIDVPATLRDLRQAATVRHQFDVYQDLMEEHTENVRAQTRYRKGQEQHFDPKQHTVMAGFPQLIGRRYTGGPREGLAGFRNALKNTDGRAELEGYEWAPKEPVIKALPEEHF